MNAIRPPPAGSSDFESMPSSQNAPARSASQQQQQHSIQPPPAKKRKIVLVQSAKNGGAGMQGTAAGVGQPGAPASRSASDSHVVRSQKDKTTAYKHHPHANTLLLAPLNKARVVKSSQGDESDPPESAYAHHGYQHQHNSKPPTGPAFKIASSSPLSSHTSMPAQRKVSSGSGTAAKKTIIVKPLGSMNAQQVGSAQVETWNPLNQGVAAEGSGTAAMRHVSGSSSLSSLPASYAGGKGKSSIIEESQSESEMKGVNSQALDSEEDDSEADETFMDDDIDLLFSKRRNQRLPKNAASTIGGLAGSTPVRVRNTPKKLPAKRLEDLLEDLFEAEDSIPSAEEIRENNGSWSNTFFETIRQPSSSSTDSAAAPPTIVLKQAACVKILRLIKGSARKFEDIARSEVLDRAALEKQFPPPRQLYELDQKSLLRLLKLLEKTAVAAEGVQPVPAHTAPTEAGGPSAAKAAGKKGAGSKKVSPTKGRKRKISSSPAKEDEDEIADPDVDGDDTVMLPADPLQSSPRSEIHQSTSKAAAHDSSVTKAGSRAKFLASANLLMRSTLAAECIFAIMSGHEPPKVLLAEDIIQTALEPVKACVELIIIPYAEAASEAILTGSTAPFFAELAADIAPEKPAGKKGKKSKQAPPAATDAEAFGSAVKCMEEISKIYELTHSALVGIQWMCLSENVPLSDAVAITLVYLSLKPFFMAEPDSASFSTSSKNKEKSAATKRTTERLIDALGGIAAFTKLRRPCLSVLRLIFAKDAQQRTWIIEEILTSLIKLPDVKKGRRSYRLSNSASVHPVSALLMQLVQSAAHIAAPSASMINLDTTARQIAQQSSPGPEGEDVEGEDVGKTGQPKLQGYSLEGCSAAAQSVASFFVGR